jgi:hypothetical protein
VRSGRPGEPAPLTWIAVPRRSKGCKQIGWLAALAAILLLVAVSLAALRRGPRSLGWAGFPAAALLMLAIAFVGFLVLAVCVLAAGRRPCIRPPRCDGGENRCDAVDV